MNDELNTTQADADRIINLEREIQDLRNEVLRTRRVIGYWFLAAFVVFALRDALVGPAVWGYFAIISPVILIGFAILSWSNRRIEALKSARASPAERMNPSKLLTSPQTSQGT